MGSDQLERFYNSNDPCSMAKTVGGYKQAISFNVSGHGGVGDLQPYGYGCEHAI